MRSWRTCPTTNSSHGDNGVFKGSIDHIQFFGRMLTSREVASLHEHQTGTALDPASTRADRLVGNVVGKAGKMPKIIDQLMVKPVLMQRVVGMESKKEVENLRLNEPMMLVVGTAPTVGVITRLHGDEIELALKRPVVAEKGQRIAIGRRVENKWRLIGYAEI